MSSAWSTRGLWVAAVLFSCSQRIDAPKAVRGGALFSDGAHAGNPHFFLLPPLVPQPAYSGVFDGAESPVVTVCQLSPAGCAPVIAQFSMSSGTGAQVVRADPTSELYIVNWKTDTCESGPCTLPDGNVYRVRVTVAGALLGFADTQIVASQGQAKNVNSASYFALVDGRTLPIKFRIEQGAIAVVPPGGGSASIGPAGGAIATSDGAASLVFPPGALTATTSISLAPAADFPPTQLASAVYDFGPDGAQFAAPVTLTLAYSSVPAGVDETSLRLSTARTGDLWEDVPGAAVDTLAHVVSGGIVHFSKGGVTGPVTAVAVSPASASIVAGGILQLTAATTPANHKVTWRSSDTTVATVDSAGLLTSVAPGAVSVTASSGNVTGASSVAVVPPAPVIDLPVSGFDTTTAAATIAGTGYPGASLTLADSGTGSLSAAPATVDASGNWSVAATLGFGTHAITATQSFNGETSAASNATTGTVRPAAPSDLSLTAGAGQIAAGWSGVTGATSYALLRSDDGGASYAQIADVPDVSYTDAPLANGTRHGYEVIAEANGVASAPSAPAFATTPMPAPATLSATGGTAQVSLSWSAVAGTIAYQVYRSGTSGGGYAFAGSTASTSFTDAPLAAGATFYYVVAAAGADLTSGYSPEASAITAPPPPAGLGASLSGGAVQLSWGAAAGADSYTLLRGTASGGPYTAIASGNFTSFADTGVSAGNTYFYVVTAANAGGTSAPSSEVSITDGLAAPTGLSATAGLASISLAWTGSAGASSYQVLRLVGTSFVVLSAGLPDTSFVDQNLQPGTQYTYEVRAVAGVLTSPPSATASATPLSPDPTAATSAFTASKANAVADGSDSIALTATVRNGASDPMAGQSVSISCDNAAVQLANASGATGADGAFTATATSTSAAPGVTCTAQMPGFSLTAQIAFTPAPPAKLVFLAQPSNAGIGAVIAPPVKVAIEDALGNVATSATGSVTLSLTGGSGSLGGNASRPAVAGVATFDDLTVSAGGTYQLAAISAGLAGATSDPFAITAPCVAGHVRWTSGAMSNFWEGVGAAVFDGRIYANTYGGFNAFDPLTGAATGYSLAGGYNKTPPVIDASGTVYEAVGSTLYAFAPSTGQVLWSRALVVGWQGYLASPPALGSDGTLYVAGGYQSCSSCSVPDGLTAIDSATGAVKWRFTTSNENNATPTVGGDGTIYTRDRNSQLYAVRPDGSLKWGKSISSTWLAQSASVALGADGTVYVGTDQAVEARRPADGSLIWSWSPSSYPYFTATPAIAADGTLYVATTSPSNRTLWAVNPDGTTKWSYAVSGGAYNIQNSSAAVAADGTVFVSMGLNSSNNADLYAIHPNGTLAWSISNVSASSNAGSNNLTLDDSGTLYVVDTSYFGNIHAIDTCTAGLDLSSWPKAQGRSLRNTSDVRDSVDSCAAGTANCDGDPTNACEVNVTADVNNCGGCNVRCAYPNASAACSASTCSLAQCNPGFADCNGSAADGCEVGLDADVNNCGACRHACGPNARCSAGTCVAGLSDANPILYTSEYVPAFYQGLSKVNPDGTGAAAFISPGGDYGPGGILYSPDLSRIGEWLYGGSRYFFRLMNADGSNVTDITPDPAPSPYIVSNSFGWSPDGSRAAVSNGQRLYVLNVTASPVGQAVEVDPDITDADNPDWSPDGTTIVFRRNGWTFWTIRPDGSGLQQIYNLGGTGYDPRPRYSPDGTRIAFSISSNYPGTLAMINADGSGYTVGGSGTWPLWSPSGSRLAFGVYNQGARLINADLTGSSPLGVCCTPIAWGSH